MREKYTTEPREIRAPAEFISLGLSGQCGLDKIREQRMRAVRLGLKFRMELACHEPGVVLKLNDLHQAFFGVRTHKVHAFFLHLFTALIAESLHLLLIKNYHYLPIF